MTTLSREVDKAIAQGNREFLNDPEAIAEARALGDEWRRQLEAEGILPSSDSFASAEQKAESDR